jgi:hypothetical protein
LTGANGFGYRRNMAWKKSPPELVQRFEKVAASLGTERRKMFGYPASFVHGNMFAGLHEDRFVLRLGEEHLAEAMRAGARAFEPMPGRPMKGWCVVLHGGAASTGGPRSAPQFPLEVLAVALFTLVVGRLGTDELAATGVAFSLNGLVFLPMVGMGMAVTALSGRYVGAGRLDLAERVTWTAFGWSLVYMTAWAFAYLFLSRRLLVPFAAGADPQSFAPVAATTAVLLRFVALYSVFDTMNAVFAGGLRGAGDTVFPVAMVVVSSWIVMLVPTYIACVHLGGGLLLAWSFTTLNFMAIGLAMLARYRAGRWRGLRVVDGDVAVPEVAAGSV